MRRGLAGLVLLFACAVLLRAPAGAQASGGERIRSFGSTVEVADDGTVTVAEEITYDFGSTQRHGIERTIPVRYPYDDVKEGYDRVTPLEVVSVSADPGTPAQYSRSSSASTPRSGSATPTPHLRARTPTGSPTACAVRSTTSRTTTSCT